MTYTPPADAPKPRLHVLVIGIEDDQDGGFESPPQSGKVHKFARLKRAVADAERMAQDLRAGAAGKYAGEPGLVLLRNSEATRAGISLAIDEMAASIAPRETFILFVAAHGFSNRSGFYLIPHDIKHGWHGGYLDVEAIGQPLLQDWLANRIKACKVLVLLDTCESGALVGGSLLQRIAGASSGTSIGRLHEATGRPVLTAAAGGQVAFEGVTAIDGAKHGVFTAAVMEALHRGDSNGNGTIELSELVAFVEFAVPRLAQTSGGQGATRSATSLASPQTRSQLARFGSRGEDFSLVKRLD